MGEQITQNIGGEKRQVGVLRDDHKFVMRRDKNHFMRKHQGFGVSKQVLEEVLLPEAEVMCVVYEREDGSEEVYKASPEHWSKHGVEDSYAGFEPQVFLPLDDFQEVHP